MPDPRFFEDLGPLTLAELALRLEAEPVGPAEAGLPIRRVAVLARADRESLTFLADRKHAAELAQSGAGACLVSARDRDAVPAGCVALVVRQPQAAYARAADLLHRPRLAYDEAAVAATAGLEDGVRLGPGAVVGPGAQIGRGTVIGPNAVIGPGVAIGRDCQIGPNTSIGFALIGDRVRIYAGAVIGEAGFGAAPGPGGLVDLPQLGRVIIQDGVTIGANTCIDRGAYEDTVIGENTKIDNLVQIAHNVRVGRNCVMAAHTGVSGSVTIGAGSAFGGRAGVTDHVLIGEGARIGAAAGVMKDVPDGETWGGMPARPMRQWLRETAWLTRQAGPARREG